MQVDTSQAAQVVDDDGQVADDTTTFNLATVNFTADGGDSYLFADVGLSSDEYAVVSPDYRQALQTFIEVGLGGTVTAEAYPDSSGRIVIDAG